jgi:hypothetical protein
MKIVARLACYAIVAAVTGATTAARAQDQDTDACIAASEQALSLRKAQKLIEERAALSSCAASRCPDPVRSSCLQRLGEVSRGIPSIVFVTEDGAGHDLANVKLDIDGTAYASPIDGSAIELDPGEHVFRFQVEGQAPIIRRLVLHQNEQDRRESVVLGAAQAATAASPPGSPPATPAKDVPPRDGTTQRAIGLTVGAVGAGAVVAGAIVGGLAWVAHDAYEKNCGSSIGVPQGQCNAQGVRGESDAATKGTAATILFLGGGVMAAAGTILFFTAPKGGSRTRVGVGPGGVVLMGQL